ncbi:MAG: PhzF family phenazine biosynthesis isomerase [Clostridia bacterium]|nr:PhzF family phenazine biosynthesis isomerase [Clostridia bacterium]
MRIPVYDAFTATPGGGNPAGVVLDAAHLTDGEMQRIAARLGFNESAFVTKNDAELRIRYFTPGHEVPLCGHATVAALTALSEAGMLPEGETFVTTGAGVLPMRITGGAHPTVTMTQTPYEEKPFTEDTAALLDAIGLTEADLDPALPIVYARTGLWTVLLPITTLAAFSRMRPDNRRFPEILKAMPRASVHPFTLETRDADCRMHGRHFSSPFSGTVEDRVTGTASGAMGGYYRKHVPGGKPGPLTLTVEQGHELGLDGRVTVHVPEKEADPIAISGTAVLRGYTETEL